MNEHEAHDEPDEQTPGDEPHTPSGDTQSTPEPNVDREEDAADESPASDEPAAADDAAADDELVVEPIDDLDDVSDVTPVDAVAESLREALGTMREEADRIATLGTGEEQVAASEKFAEDAGKLDEQVGAAARAADDADRG